MISAPLEALRKALKTRPLLEQMSFYQAFVSQRPAPAVSTHHQAFLNILPTLSNAERDAVLENFRRGIERPLIDNVRQFPPPHIRQFQELLSRACYNRPPCPQALERIKNKLRALFPAPLTFAAPRISVPRRLQISHGMDSTKGRNFPHRGR